MALLGASIALFAYTKIVVKPTMAVSKDSSKVEATECKSISDFTSDAGGAD